MPSALVRERVQKFLRGYELIIEQPKTFDVWLSLCVKYDVIGKSVHDARHVATALSQNIDSILTHNVRHFSRFLEVQTYTPAEILQEA
jgi:aminopeptidase C